MWKPEHRRTADRRGLRYPSDLTDAEWALVGPAIPPAKRGGRRREVNVRELNAIFYVLSTGCQWAALPKDLPPKSTANRRGLRPSRHGPPHAPTLDQASSLFLNPNFMDRLLTTDMLHNRNIHCENSLPD